MRYIPGLYGLGLSYAATVKSTHYHDQHAEVLSTQYNAIGAGSGRTFDLDAVRYDDITFIDALRQRLNVMDATAFSLCLDNDLPILVFDLSDPHAIRQAVLGEKIGTLVHS